MVTNGQDRRTPRLRALLGYILPILLGGAGTEVLRYWLSQGSVMLRGALYASGTSAPIDGEVAIMGTSCQVRTDKHTGSFTFSRCTDLGEASQVRVAVRTQAGQFCSDILMNLYPHNNVVFLNLSAAPKCIGDYVESAVSTPPEIERPLDGGAPPVRIDAGGGIAKHLGPRGDGGAVLPIDGGSRSAAAGQASVVTPIVDVCPGCLVRSSVTGNCVDPPACPDPCAVRNPPSCACAPPPSCPVGQKLNDRCQCVDRCDGYMRNCAQFEGCMQAMSGNGSICNGRKNQSQADGCWADKPGC